MGYLLLIAVILFVVWFFVKGHNNEKQELEAQKETQLSQAAVDMAIQELEDSMVQTYDEMNALLKKEFVAWEQRFCTESNPGFKIAGINFQHLTDRYLGAFKGTVKYEDWNAYDSKAIAIYRGQKKIGYVPKEEASDVWATLDASKGKLECYGCVYKWYKREKSPEGDTEYHDFYAGKIVIGPLESVTDEGDTGQNTGS